jgi:tetratricopeptide (TPR) repeat protein
MCARLSALLIASVLFVAGCTTTVSETTDYEVGSSVAGSVVDTRINHLREEAAKYPRRSDLQYDIALLYFQKGDYHESQEALEDAIEIAPEVSEYHYHLGRVLLRMQELELAEGHFREAVRLQPRNRYSGPHAALGWTLTLRQNWDGALTEFQRCVEIEPANSLFYYFLGSIYDLKGDQAKAITNFQEYLTRGGKTFRTKTTHILEKLGVEVETPQNGESGSAEILFGPVS